MEAYGSRFDSVFVILHPFVSVPEHIAWKATKEYPNDEQILTLGAKCTWDHVAAQIGLRDCAKLNQALQTSIAAIREEFRDYPACDTLKNFLESESVWMPNEGQFETLLQLDFLDTFDAAGQEELIFVPEFPIADPIQKLNLMRLRNRVISFPSHGTSLLRIHPSCSLSIGIVFSPSSTARATFVTEVARRQNLEGFFATPTTEHFWFNYSLGCCVVTLAPEVWASARKSICAGSCSVACRIPSAQPQRKK